MPKTKKSSEGAWVKNRPKGVFNKICEGDSAMGDVVMWLFFKNGYHIKDPEKRKEKIHTMTCYITHTKEWSVFSRQEIMYEVGFTNVYAVSRAFKKAEKKGFIITKKKDPKDRNQYGWHKLNPEVAEEYWKLMSKKKVLRSTATESANRGEGTATIYAHRGEGGISKSGRLKGNKLNIELKLNINQKPLADAALSREEKKMKESKMDNSRERSDTPKEKIALKRKGAKNPPAIRATGCKSFDEVKNQKPVEPSSKPIRKYGEFQDFWKKVYAKYYPGHQPAWGGPEMGCAKWVMKQVASTDGDIDLKDFTRTMIRSWPSITDNFKDNHVAKGLPQEPNIVLVKSYLKPLFDWYQKNGDTAGTKSSTPVLSSKGVMRALKEQRLREQNERR